MLPIDEALKRTGVLATQLTLDHAQRLRSRVEERFAQAGSKPLWARFSRSIGRRRSDGWRLISRFFECRPVVLFADRSEDGRMWLFSSGFDVERVLGESSGFEFYLTDEDGASVLCFNHHDFIVGVGASVDWLVNVPEDQEPM